MKSYLKCISLFLTIHILFLNSAESQQISWSLNSSKGKCHYSYIENYTDYEVHTNGEITLTDDDMGIKSISPGGYLKIDKRTFGNKRSLNIESNSAGVLNYQYFEGRSEIPYEPEGKNWLAEILLDVVRITGIDAEGRTKRIYARKGTEGVLQEIHYIESNSVMALYFDALLKNFTLSDTELINVCSAIPTMMTSNSEMGSLFRKYTEIFTRNNAIVITFFRNVSRLTSNTERGSILTNIHSKIDFSDLQVIEAYFSGIDKMTSNTEVGSILRNLEDSQTLSNNAYSRLLMSVNKLTSNTEMGSTLRSLQKTDLNDYDVSMAYFNAIDAITSNTEASLTIQYLIRNFDLSEDNYVKLLGSTKKLVSNTEVGAILRSIKKINLENGNINEAYFLVISSLVSNTEAGSALRYTMRTHKLNTGSWISLLKVTASLTSNTEMGSVLFDASLLLPYDIEPIVDAFFNATNKFTSSTEHGRVLRSVISAPGFNKYSAYKLLESASKLISNTEKGSVLVRLCQTPFVKDPEIKKMYLNTARTITSDTEYRRAIENLTE
jgi:hypothetical protein